jgi:hypothetical protein
MTIPEPISKRTIDWKRACFHLDERGFAMIPGLLTRRICLTTARLFCNYYGPGGAL